MSSSLQIGIVAAATLAAACAHGGGTPAPASAPAASTAPAADAAKEGKTAVIVPDPSAAPKSGPAWGEPVSDPVEEERVRTALAAVQSGGDLALGAMQPALIVGPALWGALQAMDAALQSKGLPSEVRIPLPDGNTQQLDMRTFRDADRRALVDSPGFRKIARAFATGKARPATAAERQLFYALIPFEIAGQPVTIVEARGQRLLVLLEGGKLSWMDLMSGYGEPEKAEPAAAERPPLTSEQRAAVVACAGRIEKEAPRPGDRVCREEAKALAEAPDVVISICANVAAPIIESKPGFDVLLTWLISSGAFVIEHPERKDDMLGQTTAAVRSSLKAYAVSRRRGDPAVKVLDELAARERSGKLDSWLQTEVQQCQPK